MQEIINVNETVHPAYGSCPSDQAINSLAYRFNAGSSGARGAFKPLHVKDKPNGPFRSLPENIGARDITDGLSNVVAMS